MPVSLYLLVIPACLFPALAIPRPTEVCVRGARAKRGDPRTEPRRLSGVSSRPAKVGAAGTRLALERRDWTWHLAFPKELIEDPAILFRLARSPSAHKAKTLSLDCLDLAVSGREIFLLGFSERVCVCSCALLSLLGFWHHASSIQLKPSLTG